jgi:hypothetical protein
MRSEALKEENKTKITFGVWGFIIGAVVAMIIGFYWGGWTTSSTADKMTKEAVVASQVASQAAICVAQFIKDPKYKENLAELQKLDSWDRQKLIAKGGWDKMPGGQEATSGVADACGVGLEALMKK